jgi:hypothetical protein
MNLVALRTADLYGETEILRASPCYKTLGMILTGSPVSNRLTAKTINSAFGRSFRRSGTVRVSVLRLNQQPADRIASLSEIHEASGNG